MHASNNCEARLGLVDHVQNRTEQLLRKQLYQVRSFVKGVTLDVFVLCRITPVAGTLLVMLAVRHIRSKRRSTFDATGITLVWHLGSTDDVACSSLYFHYVLGARRCH